MGYHWAGPPLILGSRLQSPGPGCNLAEVELDDPGVVIAVATLCHLEDFGTEMAGKLTPGVASLARDGGLERREIRSSTSSEGLLGIAAVGSLGAAWASGLSTGCCRGVTACGGGADWS